MTNPFPGMNPYLEQRDYWSDFHNQLVAAIARQLAPQLVPKYRVVMDKWIYTVTDDWAIALGRPDVSIQQRSGSSPPIADDGVATTVRPVKVRVPVPVATQQAFLQVKDAATQAVVTVIEVLSPANKRGDGSSQYDAKRQEILGSSSSLVEIDLLRAGEPLLMVAEANLQSHYRILVSRANQRPTADLYPFNLADPIPVVPLPLRPEDEEPRLQLQTLVHDLYGQLGYDYFIDYAQAPPRPWTSEEVQPYCRDSKRLSES